MSCTLGTTATDVCTGKVTNIDLCWIAGTDEEFIYNLKYKDSLGVNQITDITGYQSTLEIRNKDTDAIVALSVPAQLDIPEGKFLFEVSDVDTAGLLTKTRRNLYKFRIVEVDSLGKITIRVEGTLVVRL